MFASRHIPAAAPVKTPESIPCSGKPVHSAILPLQQSSEMKFRYSLLIFLHSFLHTGWKIMHRFPCTAPAESKSKTSSVYMMIPLPPEHLLQETFLRSQCLQYYTSAAEDFRQSEGEKITSFFSSQVHSLNLCSYLCPLFLLLRIPDVFILKFILNQILRIDKVFREQNPKTVIFLQKRVEFLLQKRYNN